MSKPIITHHRRTLAAWAFSLLAHLSCGPVVTTAQPQSKPDLNHLSLIDPRSVPGTPGATSPGPIASPAATPPDPAAEVTGLVRTLSVRGQLTADDYARLARTTLTYGQTLQSSGQPIPPGPIQDALAATDAGEALDLQAADWPTLRRDLRALLKEPDKKDSEDNKSAPSDQKPEQNSGDSQDKKDGQKNDSSQDKSSGNKDGKDGQSGQPDKDESKPEAGNPDQKESGQEGKKPGEASSKDDKAGNAGDDKAPSNGQPSQDGKPDSSAAKDQKDETTGKTPPPPSGRPGQKAFAEPPASEKPDGKDKEKDAKNAVANSQPATPPPPAPSEMQQVGGLGPKTTDDPSQNNPALTVPMQKLEQVRQKDSPGRLFQLLKESRPTTTEKDW